MADEQDLPDERPESDPPPPPAKKTPAKAAKKTPAKKAPAAKKAPVKKAAAKRAPAKKAPAKKAPAKKAPEPPAVTPPEAATAPAESSVKEPPSLSAGAKVAAAQAKSTVDGAVDAMTQPVLIPAPQSDGRSKLTLAVAFAVSVIALLLIRRWRHRDEPGID